MQAHEFINNLIPSLKLGDNTGKALSMMEEIRINNLPVVDHGVFVGLINGDLIFDLNNPETPISEMILEGSGCWVFANQHIYDVLRVSAEHHSNLVAILDRKSNYLGVVTMEDSISAFSESLSIQSHGGVLILSMNMNEYSLTEISRIVESENGKILSSLLSTDPLDNGKIKLTLKIDKTELRHIKATLERFGYRILDQYQEEEEVSSEEDRIGNLLRFLDI
jgi:CBS domain-containing protein